VFRFFADPKRCRESRTCIRQQRSWCHNNCLLSPLSQSTTNSCFNRSNFLFYNAPILSDLTELGKFFLTSIVIPIQFFVVRIWKITMHYIVRISLTLIVRNGSAGSGAVKIFNQGLVSVGRGDVKSRLPFALRNRIESVIRMLETWKCLQRFWWSIEDLVLSITISRVIKN